MSNCHSAHEVEFVPIDDFEDDKGLDSSIRPSKTSKKAIGSALGPKVRNEQEDEDWEPVRLENGKWACNHKCKDKTAFVLPLSILEPVGLIFIQVQAFLLSRRPR